MGSYTDKVFVKCLSIKYNINGVSLGNIINDINCSFFISAHLIL